MFKPYRDVVSFLGFQSPHPSLEKLYSQFCLQGDFSFMTQAELEDCLSRLNLGDLPTSELFLAWDAIEQEPQIRFGLSFLRYAICIGSHPSHWLIKHGPKLNNPNLSDATLEVMLILSLIPLSLRDHQARGIAASFATFNLNHLRNYIRNYYNKHQRWGIEPFGWTTYLASLGLLPIGSLQFMHHIFTDPYHVFQNQTTKEFLVLCNPGLSINRFGQFSGVNGVDDIQFKTTWEETDITIMAHPVHPKGIIMNKVIQLDKNSWKLCLKSGSPVIDFHIPTGAKYDLPSMKQTFEDAIAFFHRHYPEHPYLSFWCVSWLYSPQLPWLITKPASKILAIQEQGYLCPATPGEKSLFTFVFHTESPDLATIQPKTSLDQDVITFLKKGGKINAGLFLYFFDDITRFGTKPYASQVDETPFLMIQPFMEVAHD